MPTTDRITICNRALFRVGANQISGFTDGTVESDACAVEYDASKAELLAEHPWNFAEKVASLARYATAQSADFTATYALPTDLVRLIEVQRLDGYRIYQRWRVRGLSIDTDQTEGVQIVYTHDAPEQTFPPLFAEALVLKLAGKLAGPLTEDLQASQRILSEFDAVKRKAAFQDSIQDPSYAVQHFPLIDVHSA
jgi:hypothetical protein